MTDHSAFRNIDHTRFMLAIVCRGCRPDAKISWLIKHFKRRWTNYLIYGSNAANGSCPVHLPNLWLGSPSGMASNFLWDMYSGTISIANHLMRSGCSRRRRCDNSLGIGMMWLWVIKMNLKQKHLVICGSLSTNDIHWCDIQHLLPCCQRWKNLTYKVRHHLDPDEKHFTVPKIAIVVLAFFW